MIHATYIIHTLVEGLWVDTVSPTGAASRGAEREIGPQSLRPEPNECVGLRRRSEAGRKARLHGGNSRRPLI
jgi:hypothetical protein